MHHFEPSVPTFSDLPITGNEYGDIRKTRDTGIQYYWSETDPDGNSQNWRIFVGPTQSTVDPQALDNIELELATILADIACFKEFSYTGTKLTLIEIWDSAAKLNLLFSKAFNYTGDLITSIVLTRLRDSAILTKTLLYDVDNKVSSITKTIS